jgi:DNA-binding ferritin-like protein (Dps family)
MNVDILRNSRDFKEFIERVKELNNHAAELVKTEQLLYMIHRLQGRIIAFDEIITLLDQIEAEEKAETGEED